MSAILTTTQFPSDSFTPIRFFRLALNKARPPPPVTKQVGYVCCRGSLTESRKNGGALVFVAIGIALATPLSALSVPSISPTPYSQSRGLQLGLENGIIRACPSTNPTCISTTSRSASFALPWRIPQEYSDNVIKKIEDAILKTQKNPKIVMVEDSPSGCTTVLCCFWFFLAVCTSQSGYTSSVWGDFNNHVAAGFKQPVEVSLSISASRSGWSIGSGCNGILGEKRCSDI